MGDNNKEILLTEEGYKKMEAELEKLKTETRAEIAERIKVALGFGDLSENSEYDSAKNEQAELEERIIKLENMIRKAKIINEDEMNIDRVSVGLRVKVQNVATKDEMEFTIVGSTEADPFEGKISNESEVGKSLLGKQKGETVEILVPDGTLEYKIIDITK